MVGQADQICAECVAPIMDGVHVAVGRIYQPFEIRENWVGLRLFVVRHRFSTHEVVEAFAQRFEFLAPASEVGRRGARWPGVRHPFNSQCPWRH